MEAFYVSLLGKVNEIYLLYVINNIFSEYNFGPFSVVWFLFFILENKP